MPSVELLERLLHEVISPLNGLIGTLDNVIDGTVQDHEREERLKEVYDQLETTVDQVRSLPERPEMRDTLEVAEHAVTSELLATFVHQVVNPLTGVLGTVDNILDGTVEQARRGQRLRAVRAQLEHSVELVRNLAYLSPMFRGTQIASVRAAHAAKCVLPQVIIEAALFFQEAAADREMRIHLTNRETQYVVAGHPALFRQVFMNLFENAVKYGVSGTTIEVAPRVQSGTRDLLIEVKGPSIGFDGSEAEEIFRPQYRGRMATTMIKSGSGLGLFVCRQLLEGVEGAAITAEHAHSTALTTFRLRFAKYGTWGNHAP